MSPYVHELNSRNLSDISVPLAAMPEETKFNLSEVGIQGEDIPGLGVSLE
jgi:hypothetical protein